MTVRQAIPIKNPLLVDEQFLTDLDAHLRTFDDILIDQYARAKGLASKDVTAALAPIDPEDKKADFDLRALKAAMVPKYTVTWKNGMQLNDQVIEYTLEIMKNEVSEVDRVEVEYGKLGYTNVGVDIKDRWATEKIILVKTDHSVLPRISGSMLKFMQRHEPENAWLYRRAWKKYISLVIAGIFGGFVGKFFEGTPNASRLIVAAIGAIFFSFIAIKATSTITSQFPDVSYKFGLYKRRHDVGRVIIALATNIIVPLALALILTVYGPGLIGKMEKQHNSGAVAKAAVHN